MGRGRSESQEDDGQSDAGDDQRRSGGAKRRRKLRRVAVAAVGTILAGAIAQSLSGALTTGFRTAWSWVAGGEPIAVQSQPRLRGCGDVWVVPGRVSAPMPDPRFNAADKIRAWARREGAVKANRTMVELTIRGESSDAVVLNELRVRVVDRNPPLRGTVQHPPPCGGGITPRLYTVDLDAARPIANARVVKKQEAPPVSFPYKVTHGDPEVIRVIATTDGCDCRWVLELVYVDGAKRSVKRIDDHGRPFRTTATPGN